MGRLEKITPRVGNIAFEKVTEIEIWQAEANGISFVLALDGRHNVWTASYKRHGKHPSIFIGERVHPKTGHPSFDTRAEAEGACVEAANRLRLLQ